MSLPIEIPVATGHTETEEQKRSDGPKLQEVKQTVLVVEDDPCNRELLVEMLSMWGYEPLPVGSAEEAEFATRRKRVTAAVVDVFLPGKSGTNLMAKLRERFPEAVVIGMSALGDAAMARKCKGLGADLFISKPVTADELSEALKSRHVSWQ
jgi:DNA-binding response OmpR family regulator